LSFRQNNETKRKWDAFYQANKELIEEIGLPGPTVDTWDRFADLLMHGVIDHHDDPSHFNLDGLPLSKRKLFRVLIERYFEAGFPNPGMHPAMVGGEKAFLKMVERYPEGFGEYYQKEADGLTPPVLEEWWLDSSALPDLFWARLSLYSDGSADVLDLDGVYHEFSSREEAQYWLGEDEYKRMSDLIEDGELPPSIAPPTASSDAELVLKMLVYVDRGDKD
jgi:hypothetical protein